MTPLKEMYERLAELKAKETRYSEEEAEISELNSLIALREKYLMRYINHAPHMLDRVNKELQVMVGMPNNQESKQMVCDIVGNVVNSMMAAGQIFGMRDRDDLITFLNSEVVIG